MFESNFKIYRLPNTTIMKAFEKTHLFGFVAIITIIFFSSCSKERQEKTTTPPASYVSCNDFYTNNAPQVQSFTIDSLGGDTIKGMNGTKIWGIPKTIFMYASNHQDIIYPYTLYLIEAYSMKNMILERLPNIAQNKILQSAGELFVTAYKDTNALVLKQNCGLHLWSPSTTTTPDASMKVYYGFTKNVNDWNTDVTQTSDYLFSSDTVTKISVNGNGYSTKISKLGWVSLNHTFNYSTSSVTFSVNGTMANTNNIDLYVIFKNRHSFVKVTSTGANNFPTGEPVTVFAIAKDTNGQMYYYEQDYTISNGLQVALTMTASTEAQILSLLGTL